ncbi:protein SSUH2 homolog, partial [Genypterus blacodes]|uniref:protein SSUH2 homolog n=1 Tax=Genypterus blacodes TaxID=154954 RepID=UPI003F777135
MDAPSEDREPSLSREAAQEAFLQYASDKCCFNTKPAVEGVITNMETFDTHRYNLDTFTEVRSAKWSSRPYYGGPIDNDPTPPGLWDLPVSVPALFEDSELTMEVPHSECVKRCDDCHAAGRVQCDMCSSNGSMSCTGCGGCGVFSNGEDEQNCFVCGGSGEIV